MFSDDDIQRVRSANDIVELFSERVVMRQRGRDFWCCCPFHQEKTPSCKVDASTQTWHCFGCGEGGDIFTYVCKLDDCGFVDAMRFLARRGGVELVETRQETQQRGKKARLKAVCNATAEFYHTQLMRSRDAGPAAAREYLAGRGLGGSVPKTWNLGFAPGRGKLVAYLSSQGFSAEEMVAANVAVGSQTGGRGSYNAAADGQAGGGTRGVRDRFFNRVMFPIYDIRGDVIAFGGRVIGSGEPKYLNTGETPIFHKSEVLYALDKAKASMTSTGIAIVVEGYTDVIALHEAGFTNVVATLGTALTRQHIRQLSHHAKNQLIYLFDGDEAGQRAADRALAFIDSSITPEAGAAQFDLCAVTLPDNLDPADFIAQRGVEAFKEVLAGAVPLVKFGIDRRLERYDLNTPEGKARAVNEALTVLAPINTSLLAKDYAVYIAGKTHMREADVLQRLSELKAPTTSSYEQRDGRVVRAGSTSSAGAAGGAMVAGAGGAPNAGVQNATGGVPGNHSVLGGSGLGSTDALGVAEFAGGQSGAGGGVSLGFNNNRYRVEQEFLALCANNPAMIEPFAATLGSTQWVVSLHEKLAFSLLDCIAQNPNATAAEVMRQVEGQVPGALKVLTASTLSASKRSAHDNLQFLADELAIGDMEHSVSAMNDQMRNAASDEERNNLFEAIMALQRQLNAKRANHSRIE